MSALIEMVDRLAPFAQAAGYTFELETNAMGPDPWRAQLIGANGDAVAVVILRPYEARATVLALPPAGVIRDDYPYDDVRPSITVSPARAPGALWADIARRLLPAAAAWQADLAARAAARLSAEDVRGDALADAAAAVGHTVRIRDGRLELPYGDGAYGHLEPNHLAEEWTVDVRRVPADRIGAVLRALTGWEG